MSGGPLKTAAVEQQGSSSKEMCFSCTCNNSNKKHCCIGTFVMFDHARRAVQEVGLLLYNS